MRKKLLLLLLVVGITSCKNDTDVIEETSQPLPNPIAEAAIKFKNDIEGHKTRAGETECVVKSIKKMTYGASTRSAAEDRSIYSVAFEQDMGSVIVANVNESYVPLAYFMKEQDLDIDECLQDTLSDLGFLMGYVTEIGLNADIEPQLTRATSEEDEIIERVAPKCKVRWHQDEPYNKYCFTASGEQACAGCVAIAGAQALTVLQPDNDQFIYHANWYWVTQERHSDYIEDQIAKLIHYIGESIGMKYGTNSSKADHSKLRKFLLDTYELNGSKLNDYDADRAIDVLKTEHGVIIITGYRAIHGWGPWEHVVDAHEFIGDGYVKYNTNKDPYYLHLNYGKGDNKPVYVLSSKKKWKVDEGREASGTIYTHELRFCSLTYTSEKNW